MIKQDASSDRGYNNPDLQKTDVLISGLSKSALRWVVASLSLILFIAIVALTYSIAMNDVDKGAIPIIRADGGPLKVKPENPGGTTYPHQDLSIYQKPSTIDTRKNVELIDTVEEPLERPSLITENRFQNKDSLDNNTIKNSEPDETSLVTVSGNPHENISKNDHPRFDNQEQKQIQLRKTLLAESEKTIQNIVEQKERTQPTPLRTRTAMVEEKKVVTSPAPSSGSIYVQIGAFRSEAEALTAFKSVKSRHSILSSSGHNIVKVDLGSKGIFYRLRVGPYASKYESQSVCSQLKAKGQACL